MAMAFGLPLCHTTRGRLTVISSLLCTLVLVTLVYSFIISTAIWTMPITRKDTSQLREGRLMTQSTTTLNCSLRTTTRKFPSALIIGVRKGGTRALIDMLKLHPEVVAATSEVHYFDREENFAKGVQWYIDHMPLSTNTQISIEKSPSYFVSHSAVERIHAMSPPNIKLILIVRNPLDRTVSDYAQLLRKGRNRGSFEAEAFLSPSGNVNSAFMPVSVSMYDLHFERWLEYFKPNQILIVDGDALIKAPVNELRKVEEFLHVGSYFKEDMFYFNATKGFYCWKKNNDRGEFVPTCLGSAKGHRPPQLSNAMAQKLDSFFQPHNERFFSMTKQRFNWSMKHSIIASNVENSDHH